MASLLATVVGLDLNKILDEATGFVQNELKEAPAISALNFIKLSTEINTMATDAVNTMSQTVHDKMDKAVADNSTE